MICSCEWLIQCDKWHPWVGSNCCFDLECCGGVYASWDAHLSLGNIPFLRVESLCERGRGKLGVCLPWWGKVPSIPGWETYWPGNELTTFQLNYLLSLCTRNSCCYLVNPVSVLLKPNENSQMQQFPIGEVKEAEKGCRRGVPPQVCTKTWHYPRNDVPNQARMSMKQESHQPQTKKYRWITLMWLQ